jgi:hypothetical protein
LKRPSIRAKRRVVKTETPTTLFLATDEHPTHSRPGISCRATGPTPTPVYETYWRFAVARQELFFRRLSGSPAPWTNDPILREYKFTNAYRASDRVSQFLIRHVIYRVDLPAEPSEIFFRVILFKTFNKISTWERLQSSLGPLTYASYAERKYDRVLQRIMAQGESIYSGAYIMPSGGRDAPHKFKHQMHLALIRGMMRDSLPSKLAAATSMETAFSLLRSYPTLGDFLAYQYTIDLNYSPIMNFDEDDFVVPGPGARDGIRKCFADLGGYSEAEVIHLVTERQQMEFDARGLDFKSLWGRRLHLIDCQNLFCEVDKYARVKHPEISGRTGRTRIKQRYKPSDPLPSFWYPPKWGINSLVNSDPTNHSSMEDPSLFRSRNASNCSAS